MRGLDNCIIADQTQSAPCELLHERLGDRMYDCMAFSGLDYKSKDEPKTDNKSPPFTASKVQHGVGELPWNVRVPVLY